MKKNKQQILGSLHSREYEKRYAAAQRFESISGGGIYKKIERLVTAPQFYVPYLLSTKAGFSRLYATPINLFWGRRIYVPMEDYDDLVLYMYGGLVAYEAEQKFTKFLIKNFGPEEIFYDIGANRGFYTFLAAELCKETHSFEPMKRLTRVIKNNAHYYDKPIFVNTVALSDKEGITDFYISQSSGTNTMNADVANIHSERTQFKIKKITVPTSTLSSYIGSHTPPTLLKIDAEGAEAKIIKGGYVFFSSHSPTIAMEIWGKENKWQLSMAAVELLRSMGYHSFRIDDEGDLQEIIGDISALVLPQSGENFIFKK